MSENQTTIPHIKMLKSLSPEHTQEIGEQLLDLTQNAILALVGDLGAGKTHLSRALCLKAGVELDQIQSPTFTLINHYDSAIPVVHMDTYRLSEDEFMALGIEEIFQSQGIKIVEWADKIERNIPRHALWIYLSHESINERIINFHSYDDSWADLIKKIK